MHIPSKFRSALLSVVAVAASTAAWAAPSYKPIFLDNHSGNRGQVLAVNSTRAAVGYSVDASGVQQPTWWTSMSPAALPMVCGVNGNAYGINDAGTIVGEIQMTDGWHAVQWKKGQAKDLGLLGGSYSRASAINKEGVVVGEAGTPGQEIRAVRWKDGKPTELANLGLGLSGATALNSGGTIVGWSYGADSTRHAVRWHGKSITELGALPPGIDSIARGVNDDGVVVGSSMTSGGDHGVRWVRDVPQDLGTLGGTTSHANAVNRSGWIVGSSMVSGDGAQHAVLWADQIYDLNDLLDQATRDAGWVLLVASAINSRGDIAGSALDLNGKLHGFVLTRQ